MEPKPWSLANASPTDVFPTYDQPPVSTAGDYLTGFYYPIDVSGKSSKNDDGRLFLAADIVNNCL